MALICAICGAENPATNRFCGQCGTQLARQVEREAGMHDQRRDRSETDLDVSTKKDEAESEHVRESRGEALRFKANAAAANTGNDAGTGNAVDVAPANSGATQPLNKYRIVIERENTARTGFLGLSDDGTADYAYDDEERKPPSQLWRNIAVCVVAVAVSLTAWQWRSIRDYGLLLYGLASGQDGVSNPPAVAAESASRTLALPAKSGASAVGESSSGADHARPVQQTGSSQESAPGAATSNQSAHVSPRAMGAPAANVPDSQSVSNQPTNFRPSRTADPAGNLPRNALTGAYEMSRAAHAGDAEVRAMWLWKAVGKGNQQARVELARMYVQGNGVAQNCDQARVLLRGNEQAKPGLQQVLLQGGCSAR